MRSAQPPRLPHEGERLIAIDTGRRDVVFGSVYGSQETVRLSTAQLCHDSGRRWSKRLSDKVFSTIKHADTALAVAKANLPSSKTSSWVAWEIFVSEYTLLMQPTLDAWKKKCFRKTAFWCYGKRDTCLDTLCKDITGGVRVRSWLSAEPHPAQHVSDTPSVPQKRLRNRLMNIHGARVSIL